MKRVIGLLLVLVLLTAGTAFAETEEGLLRRAIRYDMTTMDVAQTTDDYFVPMNVYDRLFETRPAGSGSTVEKSLCADVKVSEDGLTYDFTLLDGVVFSNGNALTASDVKYTFERLLKVNKMNTDIPSEVVGADEVTGGTADSLSGFTVTDDTHFTIVLKAPNAGFLAELTAPAMSIVDEESVTAAANYGTDPKETIGTGPYMITEWVVNDHYTLEYNPKWRGEKPSVTKVIVSVLKEPSTQDAKFQTGELDLLDLENLDSLIVDQVYKTAYADRIVDAPVAGLVFLILNENNEYLKDVRVRKAIGMAIDVDKIIAGVYNGNASREYGIIPGGVQGHNDQAKRFAFDPEGARKLLAEAGYTDGQIHFELALDTSFNTSVQTVYDAIHDHLKAVGIDAAIKSYEHSAFLEKRRDPGVDAYVGRWLMDYNDPANIMYTFFGTVENTRSRSLNYPDTEVIARVAAAPAIVDEGARISEYQALEEKIIGEDVAWIPLLEERHLFCLGERVESFTPQWAGFSDFYVTDVVLK